MEYNTLLYLLLIEKYGSLLEASKHIHISQPALSARVKQLEADLNVSIFNRNCANNRLSFSSEGRIVLDYAKQFQDLEAAMRDHLQETGKDDKLIIGVGRTVGTYITPYLLPDLLERFNQDYPSVKCVIKMKPGIELLQQLEQKQIHIAFSIARPSNRRLFSLIPIYEDEMRLTALSSFEIPDTISPQELKSLPLILRESTSISSINLEKGLKKIGVSRDSLHLVSELFSNEAVKQAIRSGSGIGFLPTLSIYPHEQALFKTVRIKNFKVKCPVCIIVRKNMIHDPLIRRFIDLALQIDVKKAITEHSLYQREDDANQNYRLADGFISAALQADGFQGV